MTAASFSDSMAMGIYGHSPFNEREYIMSIIFTRIIDWLISTRWQDLPVISHVLHQWHMWRLRKMVATLPFSEICPSHFRALRIERLAEYIVWLQKETNGLARERTVEETLRMLRGMEPGVLEAAYRVIYQDWTRLPKSPASPTPTTED